MKAMHAVITLDAEVHAIPGFVDEERFMADRLHDIDPTCDCHPAVFWDSAVAPLPLYEHRDAAGDITPDVPFNTSAPIH